MISPLDYHLLATDHFKQQPSIWNFFASHTHKEEQLKEFKTDLLKNTYKFDETSDTELYQKVSLAKEKLGLALPVYVYQAQNAVEINATIIHINGEAHIVFSGNLISLLSADELQAVIAHELSHIQLYTQLGGEVEVTDRIITAISNHYSCSPAQYETARLFKLYTEVFCDRGAYTVTGDYSPIVSSLVKISTGLQTINADSYVKQADEIFATDTDTKTLGVSHPENFIRAKAVWLWHNNKNEADAAIKKMIEGKTNIEELDLFKQNEITATTEQLIRLLLQPKWMQTIPAIALAKQYFENLDLTDPINKNILLHGIEYMHSNLHDYLAYILFDFATVDKTLEDVPLGYCFLLADELKIDKSFFDAVKKEKRLTDKKVMTLKNQSLREFQRQGASV